MNALASPISFASAYRQLRPAEKAFVDGWVAEIERDSARRNERISLALHRAIPANIVEASRGMLDKPMVRAAITERINEIAAASELTVHRVVKELMGIAFNSIGDYMEVGEDGTPYFDLSKATPEQLASIQSVEIEESPRGGRKFKIKLHDKLAGIKMLGEYMALFKADNPYWRADSAVPVKTVALPADATVEQAADLYASSLGN